MFSIHRVKSFSEIEDLKKKYFDSLRGPQEAWLEEQARAQIKFPSRQKIEIILQAKPAIRRP